MIDFILDSRLEADTYLVGELILSRVLLMDDARFPWVILVPKRANMREIIDLELRDRAMFYRETESVMDAMKRLFSPAKLNVAALGNLVPQLHMHVIARFEDDQAWPKPVWSVGERERYARDAATARVQEISIVLGRL
jgi:diadenosine tetraphosphate (Ap4A) HIT family hydrolase